MYIKYNPLGKKNKSILWEKAPDVKKRLVWLIKKLSLSWINPSKVFCFRSKYAKTRASARIWGLSRIWQIAMDKGPLYIIEVISERYDDLSLKEKDYIILHELNHIPKNFSGALTPHYRKGKRKFNDKLRILLNVYQK